MCVVMIITHCTLKKEENMRKSILITGILTVAMIFTACNKAKAENGDESVASFVDEWTSFNNINDRLCDY